jgi:hypothetical protein
LPESQSHSPLIDLVSTSGSTSDSDSQQARQGVDCGDDGDDDANDHFGGGADAHVDVAALEAQVEAAVAATKQILLKGNDACSTHVFYLSKQQTLLDIEPTARPARVESTILDLREKLADIINTPIARGRRTKKANGLLQRFLSCLGGNVSLRPDDTCSSSQADVPSPSNLKFSPPAQRDLLKEYEPLFQALFPPGRFETNDTSLLQILQYSFGSGHGPYFTEQDARAILSSRQ